MEAPDTIIRVTPPPTAPTEQAPSDRNAAVAASFLGWTLDAFDYFLVVYGLTAIARDFHRSDKDMALAITVTLAFRPIGAFLFGLLADRYGRRTPLMIDLIFYSMIEVATAFAPTYTSFLVLRALFGIGMGGEWGVGASLALESASPRQRGLLSGLLQEGYALGSLLAALAFRLLYPHFNALYPGNGWRLMFFLGGLPALLSLFIRAQVKESAAWHEHRTDWPSYRRSLPKHWRRFLYLVLLMTMMNFMSHGTQDMYPTLLTTVGYAKTQIADITMLAGIGAILGGLVFGFHSDRAGRRNAMMIAMACGLAVVPFWVAGHSPWRILVGVFLMQFFVQGAWGVIPAHLIELSPSHLRGFFPGFAYQLGVMFAASIPYVESALGERFTYTQAMGGLVALVFVGAFLVTLLGPEAKGVSFRKQDAG